MDYREREKIINSVSGNVSAWMTDKLRDEGISHVDPYLCPKCRSIVQERDWIASEKCCVICWMEK